MVEIMSADNQDKSADGSTSVVADKSSVVTLVAGKRYKCCLSVTKERL